MKRYIALAKIIIRRLAGLRNKRRFLYVGWSGNGNLGDDVLYLSIANMMKGASLIRHDSADIERLLSKLRLSGPHYFSGIILGGGTLINSHYMNIMEGLSWLNVPIHVLGSGYGSPGLVNQQEIEDVKVLDLLHEAKTIAVRGPLSARKLKAQGFSNVQIIGDPAIALTEGKSVANREGHVLVNMCMLINEYDADMFKMAESQYAQVIGHVIRSGNKIIGLAMSRDDIVATERILERSGAQDADVILVSDYASWQRLIKGASVLIGFRLHSAVLAMAAGVPAILVSYRDKCDDFMESMDMMKYAWSNSNIQCMELLHMHNDIFQNYDSVVADLIQKATYWQSVQTKLFRRISELET